MARFTGKVVIVTGAASGIGTGAAIRFAREGAILALADIDLDGLERLAASPDLASSQVHCARVDVGVLAEVEAFVADTVERFGRIDVVVNNAGIGVGGRVGELTTEQWRRCLAVDLDSVFFFSRAALPHLIKSRGAIVNTASVCGLGGDYGLAAYNTAKAGIINLTRATAIDYAADGVRANAICPGLIDTALSADLLAAPALLKRYLDAIPMGRYGTPAETAAAICFLASDEASYITGTTLTIDGGLSSTSGQPNVASVAPE